MLSLLKTASEKPTFDKQTMIIAMRYNHLGSLAHTGVIYC